MRPVLLAIVVAAGSCGLMIGTGDSGGGADTAARDAVGGADRSAGRDRSDGVDAEPNDASNSDGGGLDLSGLDLPSLDIAFLEYQGVAEDGVVCGTSTCDIGVTCCIGLGGASCDVDGLGCGMLSVDVPCDGHEDCPGEGQVCCSRGSGLSLSLTCEDQSTCVGDGRFICVSTEDCGPADICCSAAELQDLGVEIGWCEWDHCGS